MAFIYSESDSVSFYIKSSFSKDNKIITQLIERGDENRLLYFIKLIGVDEGCIHWEVL